MLVVLLLTRPENRGFFATLQGVAVLSLGVLLTALALFVSSRLARPRPISRTENSNKIDLALHVAQRVELLGFLLASGLPLRLAVERALSSGQLSGASELEQFSELISTGHSLQEAAFAVRENSKNERLKELFTKLAISDQLGMVDSSEFYDLGQALREKWLVQQSATALAIETKLLFPQVILSLPLTVLFALFPSVSMLGSSLL